MNLAYFAEKHARLTPDAEAVIDHTSGRRFTFADLEAQTRRLAHALLGFGLVQGDRVAMLSQNSFEYMALYLACARAGLIAQPLNWRLAAPELGRILLNSEPRILIHQHHFAEMVAELRNPARTPPSSIERWLEYGPDGNGSYEALLGAVRNHALALPGDGSESPIGGDDPLYILYTGGTTGSSKGVLHTHASTFHAMMNNTAVEQIRPSDVYMLTGQMFHSPVVMALTYLAHGCPIVLLNFEAKLALELIQKERVSAFLGLTTMINWMMATPGFESYDLSSLRHILYGGGPLPSSVIREAMQRFGCNFIGVYGQTEGIAMTFLNYQDHLDAVNGLHPERLKSCGREAFLSSVRVVNDAGHPVPCDGQTAGEIEVKSPANMVGYWRNPELTAQTVRHGWMRTGDIATWDKDRYIFIIDRAKDMIISGGENIYSIQVEEAISKHPAVLEVAVIGVPHDEWGEVVAAYVVLKPGAQATAEAIIDTAKAELASYQKPRIVEFLAELPKAPTGKILKRVLREAHWAGRSRQV